MMKRRLPHEESGGLLKKEKGKFQAQPRTPKVSGNEWDGHTYDLDLDKSTGNDCEH